MKITEVRTRVVEWRGKTVPLPPHFCTNPMDVLSLSPASMGTFTFHGWLLVEVFTDAGLVVMHLCRMVRLTLQHGLTPASAQGFAWFGVMIGQHFGRARQVLEVRSLMRLPEF